MAVPKEVAPGWPYPILNALGGELTHSHGFTKAQGVDPAFARRVMLRTMFSALEAYAFVLSERALSVAPSAGVTYSDQELEILKEGKPEAKPDGTLGWKKIRKQPGTRLRTAVLAFGRAYGALPPLQNGHLPNEFFVMKDARDRMAHPRMVSDFDLAPAEADAIVATGKWLATVVTWANEAEQKYIKRLADDAAAGFNRDIEALKRAAPPAPEE